MTSAPDPIDSEPDRRFGVSGLGHGFRGMQLRLAPGEYAFAFAVAVAAAVAAGLYPAFRLGRMNISRALRME